MNPSGRGLATSTAAASAFSSRSRSSTRRIAEWSSLASISRKQPRHEPYGKVAVFRDLYGNRWDLIEPKE